MSLRWRVGGVLVGAWSEGAFGCFLAGLGDW